MTSRRPLALLLTLGLVGALGAFPPEDAPPAPADGSAVVVDAAGKEHCLKKWKLTQGTRHLTWLAEAPKEKEPAPAAPPKGARPGRPVEPPRPAVGPEAFELREEKSTTYVKGVLTLIPLERIRRIDFDDEKQTIAVHLAGGEKDEVLTGTTRFRGVNKLTIQGEEADAKPAAVTFTGGVPKGIQSIRFPTAKTAPAPTGRAARVTINDEAKTVVEVKDLRPLYQLPSGAERLAQELWFRKTLHLDMKDIRKLVSTSGDALESVCRVVLADGTDETLTVLGAAPLDGQEATLVGLLGQVPAGYRLFPMHTFLQIELME